MSNSSPHSAERLLIWSSVFLVKKEQKVGLRIERSLRGDLSSLGSSRRGDGANSDVPSALSMHWGLHRIITQLIVLILSSLFRWEECWYWFEARNTLLSLGVCLCYTYLVGCICTRSALCGGEHRWCAAPAGNGVMQAISLGEHKTHLVYWIIRAYLYVHGRKGHWKDVEECPENHCSETNPLLKIGVKRGQYLQYV